jgi:transposase
MAGAWPKTAPAQVGALVVTRDGGIPIVSHAYPGDRPDVTQFSTVLDELVTRYRLLVEQVESLTVSPAARC